MVVLQFSSRKPDRFHPGIPVSAIQPGEMVSLMT